MLESGPQRVNGTRGQDMCLDSYEVRRRRSSLEAVSSVCAVNILVSDMAIYYFEVHSSKHVFFAEKLFECYEMLSLIR
jgi:hypothetical protein